MMARLCLTVEGKTEQNFALGVLSAHLAQHGVYLAKPRLTALARKKGYVHRGGLRSYEPAKNDIKRWLKQDRSADVWFTTMIDLYALPKDFPEYGRAASEQDGYQRVALLEKALEEDIGDEGFIAYIQLHEFEALLLTDPAEIGGSFPDCSRQVEALTRLCEQFRTPEEIDDGQQTCPSRRIATEVPEYLQAKAVAGPAIAARIGVDRIRQKCPHFAEWLFKLENLAT